MSVCNASFNTAELLGALVTQLLGSTAQRILIQAGCDVLAVKE